MLTGGTSNTAHRSDETIAACISDPAAGSLQAVWRKVVEAYGPRPAVSCDRVTLSFSELHHLQLSLASGLSDLGVVSGDRVAVWLPNSIEWVVAELACATLGAVIIPINARYRAPELARVLGQCRVRVLIATDRFMSNDYLERLLKVVPALAQPASTRRVEAPELPHLQWVVSVVGRPLPGMLDWNELIRRGEQADFSTPDVPASHDFLAFWTSGTTGEPKGVIHDYSVLSNIWNWTSLIGYHNRDCVLVNHPMFYIAGNFWGMLGALLHGCHMILVPDLKPETMIRTAYERRVTILSGNPRRLLALADAKESLFPDAEPLTLKGSTGGESVSMDAVRKLKSTLGFGTLLQVYGSTELQGFCMSTHPSDPDEVTGNTVGRPLPGFTVRLTSPETGLDVPPGEEGELLVRGRVPKSYIIDSQLDAPADVDHNGWFHTGDILKERADGNYRVVGRLGDVVKIKGERVSLAEVEVALCEHPAIKAAVVIGTPNSQLTESLVAFLVPEASNDTIRLLEIRQWLASRVAPHKQPAMYYKIDTTPLTTSGKAARGLLQQWATSESPPEECALLPEA